MLIQMALYLIILLLQRNLT